jgi:adenosine deaminase
MQTSLHSSAERFIAFPKVDLHRHLEGSVRFNTLVEVGRHHGIGLVDGGNLRQLVQVEADQPYTFENFLSKFVVLRQFFRSPEMIRRIAREAVQDAAADNIRYLELRFTPVALSKEQNFPLDEVIDWVIEGVKAGEQECGIKVGLIASVNRHESLDLAERVIDFAIERKGRGIIGLDLAGSEATAKATPFIGVFQEAAESGMPFTIHAGEWGGPENVFEAITKFHSPRIGHGVRVMEDSSVIALARERGTVFEVCITSNFQSGVVPVTVKHPFASMLSAGLNATLNSDDPSISKIALSQDIRYANEELGIPLTVLRDQTMTAVDAAFLPKDERSLLIKDIMDEYQGMMPELN